MKIFFDVDGVLIDGWHSRPELRRPWDATIEHDLGIDKHAFREKFFGSAASNRAVIHACVRGERDLKEALAATLPTVGYTGSVDAFVRYWFEKDSHINREVMGAVKRLARHEHVELYLATGQEHHRAAYLWDELGFKEHFKDIFYSARLGHLKSAPEFFLEINRALGIGPEEQPLFFDDREDVVALARSAGWDACVFNTDHRLALTPKAGETSLTELLPVAGKIRIGIGGWTYEAWRGGFYPENLSQKRELEYASRRLTSIEINGTYYSTFKPASWAKWRDDTSDGFVFAIKGSRYCTNRKELAGAGEAVDRFVGQGLVELRDRLGPINWQLMGNKKFDPADIEGFLKLLPREVDRLPLRHALEVRHASFKDERFYDLARRHNLAVVFADDEDFPAIEQPTPNFTYARLMRTKEDVETGYSAADLENWAKRAHTWAGRGDAFIYFISGAKVRAPAAAQALIKRVG